MRFTKYTTLASVVLAFLFAFGISTFAQGRGGGKPAGNPGAGGGGRPDNVGRPTNPGRPTDVGRPTGIGVDRGINTASDRSSGRSDRGMETARTNSGGRSDAGIERARMQRENRTREAEREMQKNPRISENLRMNANDLRAGYQTALQTNPDLKFGQYVAANMIARNLGSRNTSITSQAILSGLASGNSIGETLRSLGVSRDEAKRAEKETKRQMENSRKQ
jgi:hypothetical protein